ncbi:hypothetical protein J2X46_002896 [Nocardioides sp. BE266]|uniref:hypothetical protein n=1 Tax=Nocardioides sp. BE266 TaxID=2817725 RepID=UPI00286133D5|nr:hypothetical protein [Nocardioides sp. BE266]MDR7253906.1 hypothetical protein [Nocardioides sp. BE266]
MSPRAVRSVLPILMLAASAMAVPAAIAAEPAEHVRRGGVDWVTNAWIAGEGGYVVEGRLAGPPRKVVLQLRAGRGWRTLDRATTARRRYAFEGTYDVYGRTAVRVRALAGSGRPAQVLGEGAFEVSTGFAPRGLAGEWAPTTTEGRVQRFDPCRPVRWRFNSGGGAGDQFQPQVQQALTEVARGSGLRFRYVGTSATVPANARSLEDDTDLVVAFAHDSEIPVLGGAAAHGAPLRTVEGRAGKRDVERITQAGVTVSIEQLTSGAWSTDEVSMQPTTVLLLMHELGHAFGLADVTTPGSEAQVMYAGGTTPWNDGQNWPRWGAGDLEGLSAVGLRAGCVR